MKTVQKKTINKGYCPQFLLLGIVLALNVLANQKKRLNRGNNSLFLLLGIVVTLNFVSHIMSNVFGIGNPHYYSYVCWIILVIGSVFIKNKPSKVSMIALAVLVVFSLIPCFLNSRFDAVSEFHVAIMLWFAFYFSFCIRFWPLSPDNIVLLYKLIVILGLFSCIYALIAQQGAFLSLLYGATGSDKKLGLSEFASFFRHRNIFAEYCFLSTISALYLFLHLRKGRAIYFSLIIFFALMIFASNSRSALIGFVVLVCVTSFLKCKRKMAFLFFVLVVAMVSFNIMGGTESFLEMFSHDAGNDIDSGTERIMMWAACYKCINENAAWIWGFGIGTIGDFLEPIFGVGSSHNAYIDAYFHGGIIYFSILFFSLSVVFWKLYKMKNSNYRILHLAGLTAYSIYNMTEAGMAPFSSSFFSVTATIILIFIPLNLSSRQMVDTSYAKLLSKETIYKSFQTR